MVMLFDPPPLFQPAGRGRDGDQVILEKRGRDQIEEVRERLVRCGWPLPRRVDSAQDLNLVLDAVQCFQEGFAFGDPMLVDRDPGPFTMAATGFSVENGGRCAENFRWVELSCQMGGWIRARYKLVAGMQQARELTGNPCFVVSAFSHSVDNVRRGSTSHWDPSRQRPGSRHIWGEAIDNAYRTFRLTYRQALNMRCWTGIGVVTGTARRELDCLVAHLDVGGLYANEGGSPTWYRPGGIERPAVWWY